jgi:ribulose-5-phosphate 4-epimerase/fuculose-1-phosphate aldolase
LAKIHVRTRTGNNVPVFDIGDSYSSSCPDEQQDLLVRTAKLGIHLAEKFVKTPRDPNFESYFPPDPDYSVVLMRRHGYTTHGRDIETAVYRAIYTKINATAQTTAMTLRSALPPGMKAKFELEPLPEQMCQGCCKMNEGTHDKPWKLWVAEVENSSLYTNRG